MDNMGRESITEAAGQPPAAPSSRSNAPPRIAPPTKEWLRKQKFPCQTHDELSERGTSARRMSRRSGAASHDSVNLLDEEEGLREPPSSRPPSEGHVKQRRHRLAASKKLNRLLRKGMTVQRLAVQAHEHAQFRDRHRMRGSVDQNWGEALGLTLPKPELMRATSAAAVLRIWRTIFSSETHDPHMMCAPTTCGQFRAGHYRQMPVPNTQR